MIRRLLLLLACVAVLGGCANIPEQTLPQPIENSLAPSKQPVSGPTKDAEPITVVRDFIRANGNPIVASAYLTDEAKKLWHPNNQPTVIDDDFSTVPEPVETQGDPNRADVNVKGLLVGVLNADKSFLAQQGNYTGVVQLAKQDGQWRISRVPNNGMVVVPKAEFLQTYRLVKLYFYDGTRTVLVPDARYLPANPRPVPTDIVDLLLHGP
ncbi:hypothetical protein ACFQ1S_27890, partial [Kibdelosporangium lantanae]